MGKRPGFLGRAGNPLEGAVLEMAVMRAVKRCLGAKAGCFCAREYPDQVENECDAGSTRKPTLRDAFW